ncbi:type II toxin-antitoxin system VapC family toxin [Thermus tengchongensis]|uniref:Ribonuclease VapC n=1 Tax=Thermus tengchongensis TaxID=1214928 RepID=A0A4Y9FD13_9DEIN|nr:PIN domain-containing protein [Thermus tengchongensis]TFU27094.1 type II toxin-antitoxin system VapC family toxin [Thermus tengchongensis]
MRYLLDSTVIIDLFRGHPRVVAWVRGSLAQGATLWVTPITVAEVLAGVPERGLEAQRRFLRELGFAPLDFAVAERAARLFWERKVQGARLPLMDLLQWAAAEVHGLTLVSSNTRHYPGPVLDPREG